MGLGHSFTRFFVSWGIKYLIILIACIALLQIPLEKMSSLMLVILIATVTGEIVSRAIVGGM